MANLLRVEPVRQLEARPVAVLGPLGIEANGLVVHRLQKLDAGGGRSNQFPPVEHRPLDHEFYLRQLLDVDIDSDEALLNLMRTHGALGIRWDGREFARREFREWQIGQEENWPTKSARFPDGVPLTTMEMARNDAAVLRNAARSLLADAEILSGADLLRSWEKAPEPPHFPTSHTPWNPSDVTEAISDTAVLIDYNLGPFHPRVFVGGDGWALLDGGRPVSLFAATCAQMFNHIAENADYKVCAREDCGHLFVRQLGRAKQGQYRTSNVEYCSKACAAMVADRKRRQRDREKRAESRETQS